MCWLGHGDVTTEAGIMIQRDGAGRPEFGTPGLRGPKPGSHDDQSKPSPEALPDVPDFVALDAASEATADQRSRVLTLVGTLVFSWSNNESLFIYVLMLLLETDQPSAALVFGTLNTARARTDLIHRLAVAKLGDDPLRTELDALITRFDAATRLRNELNHSIYGFDADGVITHTSAMRVEERKGQLRFGASKPMDEKRIRRMEQSVEDATRLNRDLWSYLPQLQRHMKERRTSS